MEPTPRTYLVTYAALLVLSAVTLGLGLLSLGVAGTALAIAIAAVKSVLVAAFFMHLVEQRGVNTLALVAGVVLVTIFIGISAGEVAMRSLQDGAAVAARPDRPG